MKQFQDINWFHELQKRVNEDEEFRNAARWFKGTIGWKIGEEGYSLTISKGQIERVEARAKDFLFSMSGPRKDWEELMARGTINRLFRQNRIQIEGDKVEAMRYWKVLWYLTEIARSIKE